MVWCPGKVQRLASTSASASNSEREVCRGRIRVDGRGCGHEHEEVRVFVGVTRHLQGLNSTERKDNRHTAGGERHVLPGGEAGARSYEIAQDVACLQ